MVFLVCVIRFFCVWLLVCLVCIFNVVCSVVFLVFRLFWVCVMMLLLGVYISIIVVSCMFFMSDMRFVDVSVFGIMFFVIWWIFVVLLWVW